MPYIRILIFVTHALVWNGMCSAYCVLRVWEQGVGARTYMGVIDRRISVLSAFSRMRTHCEYHGYDSHRALLLSSWSSKPSSMSFPSSSTRRHRYLVDVGMCVISLCGWLRVVDAPYIVYIMMSVSRGR